MTTKKLKKQPEGKTAAKKKEATYTAKDIYVLKGLEPVRRRPAMYIGSTGPDGLHHLIWECVDNFIDEFNMGYGNQGEVILLPGNRVKVTDNGRGIPVEKHPQTKKSALETVMTTLHAGAKFGGKAYQVAGGLHGVGVSVVCALSKWMRAEVCRGGMKYFQEYSEGKPKSKVKKIDKCRQTGTTVIFEPDPEIFKEINFDLKKILDHLRQQAYLTKGIKITVSDERTKQKQSYSFYFEGGLASYVKYLVGGVTPRHPNIFYGSGLKNGIITEAAFQYTQEYECYEESFANNIWTQEGGTHLTAFRTALTRTFNDYARRMGLLKETDENLSGKDIREGFTGVVSVKIKDPQFEGQTKAKLGNPEAKVVVEGVVSETLTDFLERNPQDSRAIIENCFLVQKAREAAKAARETVLRKGILEGLALPGKLADCASKKPEESELYIVEGESAGGSGKQGRDRKFQAILPLRGKILNVERARLDKILASKEIKSLIIALGTAVAEDFNLDKLRYHRVIIMSVDYEEPCFIKNSEGNIRYVKIGEFIDKCLDKKIPVSQYQVLCFDKKEGKVRFKTIKNIIRHPLKEKLYEIQTSYGRRIKVTASHSLFTFKYNKIALQKVGELKKGDYIVAPIYMPLQKSILAQDEIDLLKYLIKNHPKLKEKFYWRGNGIIDYLKMKIKEKNKMNRFLIEPRISISAELREILISARQKSGLTQRELCEAVGVKQPITYYQWEKGNYQPTLSSFQAYIDSIGLDYKKILPQVEIKESELERIWNYQWRNSGRNFVKNWISVKDIPRSDIRKLPSGGFLTPSKHTQYLLKRYIPINEQLMHILGWFIAEGDCSLRNGIRFSLGESDEKFVPELRKDFDEVFGVKSKIYKDKDNPLSRVFFVRNKVLSFVFQNLFGFKNMSADTKKIPDLIFNSTPKLQLEFLRGYFLGDGSINKTQIYISTTSKELAQQLVYLLSAQGVTPSISVRAPDGKIMGYKKGKPIITKGVVYSISIVNKKDLLTLYPIWKDHSLAWKLDKKMRNKIGNYNRAFIPIKGDLVALKIKEISRVSPSRPFVYDFSVDNDENFIAGFGGICCHNSDADSDGNHIRTLLLTLFYRHFKPIIEKGYLYIAQPPLYKIQAGKKIEYAYTEDDKAEILSEFRKVKTKKGKSKKEGAEEEKFVGITIQRYKGLGEMNPLELWSTTMNPENRVLLKVTIENAKEADRIFDTLMGEEVLPRKKFIQTYAKKVKNLDI